MAKEYIIEKMGAGHMDFIRLDEKTVKRLTAGGNRRVLCTLNGSLGIHAAIMKTKTGIHYIMLSTANQKKLGVKAGSKVKAEIEIDKSELQFHIPEEFEEVMATDPEAKKVFNQLTAGNKRGLVALVNMVKSTDKRIERSLKIADRIKKGITSPQKVMKQY